MSLLTVVRDVCAVVGVEAPATSVFTNISTNRTMFEMVALATEMGHRIACEFRDWTILRRTAQYIGNGLQTEFVMPSDYRRMLITGNVRVSTNPKQPLLFINDFDQWVERRLANEVAPNGEWTIASGHAGTSPPTVDLIRQRMLVHPAPADTAALVFPYISRSFINLGSGGVGHRFVSDTDEFALDERLLLLGMIWQWKAQKGSPYAEDMGTYSDALAWAAGRDGPAPIYVGNQNISASARTAYPGPLDTAGWTWPLQ